MGYEIDPDYRKPACVFEIEPYGFNGYKCKVTQGNLVFARPKSSCELEQCFQGVRNLYDFPVNGPSRNKALKKLRRRLKVDGLELRIIEEEIKII